MSGSIKTPLLCAMMFLQFFVWGAWYVSTGGFMVHTMSWGNYNPWVYSVGPIAAIISPIFLGLIVDRYVPSQLALAAMHLIGGGLMFLVPSVATPESSPWIMIGLLFGHMLCYMPTLSLTNTIAFSHITDQAKQFPLIRVFGTLGWIVANVAVGGIGAFDFHPLGVGAENTTMPFYLAGGSALALGLFSFLLPHTPPPAAGKKATVSEALGFGALRLFKSRAFTVFIVCSFLICIPLAAYYSYGEAFAKTVFKDNATSIMSLGQVAEVLFMLVMPLMFARFGVKWMLAVGMLAWVCRYGLFSGAAGDGVGWMIIGGIVLHGICYDFFFVTGQIYVDQRADPTIRAQAQSFLVVVTQGVGMLIGMQLFGLLAEGQKTVTDGVSSYEWGSIWMYPCLFAAVILVAFVLLFRDDGSNAGTPRVGEDKESPA